MFFTLNLIPRSGKLWRISILIVLISDRYVKIYAYVIIMLVLDCG